MCAALSAAQILLIWPIAAIAQEPPTTSLTRIEAISPERVVARTLKVSPGSTYDVPLKGLLLPDLSAAKAVVGESWWEPANLRLVLLEKGIASLDSTAPVDPNEKAKQDKAAGKHLGIWSDAAYRRTHGYPDPPGAPAINPTANDPNAVADRNSKGADAPAETPILDWLRQYWFQALGVLGFLLSVFALVTWKKQWEIIIMGAASAGKTEFVGCLKHDARWLQRIDPKSTIHEEVTEQNFRSRDGRSVYHLKWCDVGGQYPKYLFERLANRRRMLLLRRRMVLVLVLSPYTEPSKPVVNKQHIDEQFGCVYNLVKGFIDLDDGKWCKGVLLLVNMSDLYTNGQRDQPQELEFRNLFSRHRHVLAHPNLLFLAGSAKNAWNTAEAWKWIMQAVSGEVQG
jgi:hypothetical protein